MGQGRLALHVVGDKLTGVFVQELRRPVLSIRLMQRSSSLQGVASWHFIVIPEADQYLRLVLLLIILLCLLFLKLLLGGLANELPDVILLLLGPLFSLPITVFQYVLEAFLPTELVDATVLDAVRVRNH